MASTRSQVYKQGVQKALNCQARVVIEALHHFQAANTPLPEVSSEEEEDFESPSQSLPSTPPEPTLATPDFNLDFKPDFKFDFNSEAIFEDPDLTFSSPTNFDSPPKPTLTMSPPKPTPSTSYQPIRMPEFDSRSVATWLNIVDLPFAGHPNLSHSERYQLLASAVPFQTRLDLNTTTVKHLSRIGEAEDGKLEETWLELYKELRTILIKHFSETQGETISKLLGGMQRGDTKPSLFLTRLRATAAGQSLDCEALIEKALMGSLPDHVRGTLAALEGLSLDDRADRADLILAAFGRAGMVNVATRSQTAAGDSPVASSSADSARLSRLETLVGTLVETVTTLVNREDQRARSPSPGRARFIGAEKSNTRCYYHVNFGERAQKCSDTKSSRPCDMAHTPLAPAGEKGKLPKLGNTNKVGPTPITKADFDSFTNSFMTNFKTNFVSPIQPQGDNGQPKINQRN